MLELTTLKLILFIVSCGALWWGFSHSHHATLLRRFTAVLIGLSIIGMEIVSIFQSDKNKIAEQAYWQDIEKHPSAKAYQTYVEKFPTGQYAVIARNQLESYKSTVAKVPLPKTYRPDEEKWQTVAHYQIKDDLVKDTKTGLMWMRCSIGQQWDGATCQGKPTLYTWDEAMNQPLVPGNQYAGYDKWHIPSINELKTLVYCSGRQIRHFANGGSACDIVYARPTINTTVFPNISEVVFWSSSVVISHEYYAWGVSFNHGYISWNFKKHSHQVRLVRSDI